MPDTATDTLLAAGRVLARIAEPKDLDALASDIGEIAATLKMLAAGLGIAADRADETRDNRMHVLATGDLWNLAERRLWTVDEIELSHANEINAARNVAARTAQRALVDLSAVIGQLLMRAAASERRREEG